jgi:hypothetical protein
VAGATGAAGWSLELPRARLRPCPGQHPKRRQRNLQPNTRNMASTRSTMGTTRHITSPMAIRISTAIRSTRSTLTEAMLIRS